MYVGFIADFDHAVTLGKAAWKEKIAYNLKMAHSFSTDAKFSEKLTLLTP